MLLEKERKEPEGKLKQGGMGGVYERQLTESCRLSVKTK